MNNVWIPPPEGFVKINIFEAIPDFPLDNGNTNGIGIILRDHNGFLLWGIMGPIHGLSHFQTQLWAIHMGMKEAYARGRNDMLIETEHVESFRILKRQNFEEASHEGLVGAIQAINACQPLLHSEFEPICRVYTIGEERNQVARFAAGYGMLNHSGLVNIDYSFMALRDLLDIDIGWGPHLPALQVQQDHVDGEVIQGAKPKKRKRVVIEEKEYEALLKLSERVARLEKSLEPQLNLMGSKDEAYSFIADPVFAFKAGQVLPPLKINDGLPAISSGPSSIPPHSDPKELSSKDKGKAKMFDEDHINPNDFCSKSLPQEPPQELVPEKIHLKFSENGSPSRTKSFQETSQAENSLIMHAPDKDTLIESTTLINDHFTVPPHSLGTEAWGYLYDSLFNMVDPPICNNDLMSLEDALLEIAMFEDIKIKQDRQDNDARQDLP